MNQLSLTPTQPEPTHKHVVDTWNAQLGSQIRYDKHLQEYVTTDGDRYCAGDIEERVRHLDRMGDVG